MKTVRLAAFLACAAWGCGDDAVTVDAAVDAPVDAADQHCQRLLDGGSFLSKDQRFIFEEEPTVASDGRGGVVAGFIALVGTGGGSTNGYAVSRDDGATWTQPVQIDSPDARISSDPVLAVDSAGNFFMSWVGYHTTGTASGTTDMRVFVARLDNTTNTFGMPVEASAGSPTSIMDKPWITIDNLDRLIVTWEDGTAGNFIWSARSADQGAHWNRAVVDTGGAFRNLAYPCLDHAATGLEVPVYVVLTVNQHTIAAYRSDDGALSWNAAVPVATDGVFQDPTCAVRGNDVWVSYAQGNEPFTSSQAPAATAVRVAHSNDRGTTFQPPVTISDGPATDRYLLSNLLVRPGGLLDALYYQGELGGPSRLRRAISSDGGATWVRSTLGEPGTLVTARGLACFEGDYIGAHIAGGAMYVAYSDNTTGKSHIKLLKVP